MYFQKPGRNYEKPGRNSKNLEEVRKTQKKFKETYGHPVLQQLFRYFSDGVKNSVAYVKSLGNYVFVIKFAVGFVVLDKILNNLQSSFYLQFTEALLRVRPNKDEDKAIILAKKSEMYQRQNVC